MISAFEDNGSHSLYVPPAVQSTLHVLSHLIPTQIWLVSPSPFGKWEDWGSESWGDESKDPPMAGSWAGTGHTSSLAPELQLLRWHRSGRGVGGEQRTWRKAEDLSLPRRSVRRRRHGQKETLCAGMFRDERARRTGSPQQPQTRHREWPATKPG